jgi:NADH-quinone oxidoreductase subunit J
MIAALSFYVFAAILLVSAGMVVSARNPVHSVLFLILAFFNAAALFLLVGAEFLAMILVIVYVGAVAVLFLFVVMMLDINFARMREGFQRYLPVGATVGVVLLAELAIVLGGWKFAPGSQSLRFAPIDPGIENTAALGRIIYTDYILMFQASGLVLLVAMIGAIVLTLRDKGPSRRQVIAQQIARTAENTVVMMDVRSGAGIRELGILRPKVVASPEAKALAETHHHGTDGGH